MIEGIKIKIVDPDDDYLGIEIFASSERYSAATRIYAGLEELSELQLSCQGSPKIQKMRESMSLGVVTRRLQEAFVAYVFMLAIWLVILQLK